MTAKTELSAPKRRTRAEVQQLLAEFVSSGMRRSEFCRSRRLSFGTLNRHLKGQRWKKKSRVSSSVGLLVPVELAAKKSPAHLVA
jgi:DNA invertase Pin-like site-specific DNA recombinase